MDEQTTMGAVPGTPERLSVSPARRLATPLVAGSTVFTIVGAAVVLFLNPFWVGFEQARTGVPTITGYTSDQVRTISDSVLGEFVAGPGTFAISVDGTPVFNARERGHLADVRAVLVALGVAAAVSILVLLVVARSRPPRAWAWQAVAVGAGSLSAAVVVAGILFAIFFEAAFEFFHRILFPAGSYNFDPRTERLVQLFPLQFWSETSIALSLVLLAMALAVLAGAMRRLRPHRFGLAQRDGAAPRESTAEARP